MWRLESSVFMAYSLALLNNVSYNVVEFAKSQVCFPKTMNTMYRGNDFKSSSILK